MRKSKKNSSQPEQIRTSKTTPAKVEPLHPKMEQPDKNYNELAKLSMAELERELTIKLLSLINSNNQIHELMKLVTVFLKDWSGCEAVGIRLRDGEDYPYFEMSGFSKEFILAENKLCSVNEAGEVIRDSQGMPYLECMCGNIISGRFDPSTKFFTKHGSFWTNSTTELLTGTTNADHLTKTRNRCNTAGYESVALIPLRTGKETFGLLQFNSKEKNRFSAEKISLLERLADNLAIGLAQRRSDEKLRKSESKYRSLFDNMVEGFAHCKILLDENERPTDFVYLDVNDAFEELTGLKNVVGKKVTEVIPGIKDTNPELFEIYGRVTLTDRPEKFESYIPSMGIWFSVSAYSPQKDHFVAVFENITQRKRAEEELLWKTAFLESQVEANLDGMLVVDSNNQKILTNQRLIEMWKVPQHIAEDKDDTALLQYAVSQTKYPEQFLEKVKYLYSHNDQTSRDEIEFKNGMVFDRYSSPVVDINGKYFGRIWTFRDITERKRVEESLKKSEEKFSKAFNATPEAVNIASLEDGRQIDVNDVFLELTGFQRDEVIGHSSTELNIWVDIDKRRQFVEEITRTGSVKNFEVQFRMRTGEIRDCLASSEIIELEGEKCCLNFILDITERKRAEEKLQKSQQKAAILAETLELSSQPFAIAYLNGRIGLVNTAFSQLTGYSKEELAAIEWTSTLTPPEWREIERRNLEKLNRTGQPVRYEKEYIRKDGSRVPVELLVHLQKDENGRPKHYYGFITDITERKRAEEALRESEERYRGFFENSLEGIGLSKGNQVVDANPALLKIFGYENLEEFIKIPLLEHVAPESRSLIQDKLKQHLKSEPSERRFEYRILRKDGETRYLEISIGHIHIGNDIYTQSTFCDITERKRAEEALRESEDRLKTALDAAQLGIWDWDIVSGRMTWAGHHERLFGFEEGQFDERLETFIKMVYPEDREGLWAEVEKSQKEKSEYWYEYRIVRPDGAIRWMLGKGQSKYDQSGRPIRMLGTVQDITERKLAEESLRTSETRFRELFKNMSSGVVVYEAVDDGKDFIIKDFNEAAEKIEKVGKETIVGKRVTEVFPGVKEMGLWDVFCRVWKTGKAEQHPTTFYKDNRISGWRENYVYKLPCGEIVAVYDDVTERKLAQEQLQNERNLLRTLIDNIPDKVYVKDKDSRFIVYNKAVSDFWQSQGLEDLDGKTDFDLFEPAEAQKYFDEEQKVMQTGQSIINKEGYCTDKSDKTGYLLVTKTPLRDNQGNVTGLLGIHRDITARKLSEEKLLEHQKQLKRLAAQLALTEERERRRIAGELHDHVSQSLALAKIKLDSLQAALSSQPMAGVIEDISGSIEKAIQDTRTLTFDLSNPILYELGFEAAVSEWLDENVRVKHKINTEFQDDGKAKPLDDDMRALLFRNVRELLFNIIKYANADKVRVSVRKIDDSIEVVVEDNGVGFDPLEARTMGAKRLQFGLFSVRESIEELGGRFEIESKPGAGCKTTMTAPLKGQKC